MPVTALRWLVLVIGLLASTVASAGAPADLLGVSDPASAEDESRLRQCEQELRSFGTGNGPSSVSPECFAPWSRAAAPGGFRQLADRSLVVAGRGGAILFRHPTGALTPPTQEVIAGARTGIVDVRALAIDSEHGELFVLNRVGADSLQILVFSLRLPGNVAPLRILAGPALGGVVALALQSARGELVLADGRGAKIVTVSRMAWGALGGEKAPLLRELTGHRTGLNSPTAVAADPISDEIYVADGARILTFAGMATGDQDPRRALAGKETGLISPQAIDYSPLDHEIRVEDPKGSPLLRFGRLLSGSSPGVR